MLSLDSRRRLAYATVMGMCMTLLITGVLTITLARDDPQPLARWMRAFLIAWPTATPLIFLLGPRVQRLVNRAIG